MRFELTLVLASIAMIAATPSAIFGKLILVAGLVVLWVHARQDRTGSARVAQLDESGSWRWQCDDVEWLVTDATSFVFGLQLKLQCAGRSTQYLFVWRDALSDADFHALSMGLCQRRFNSMHRAAGSLR